MAKSVRKLWTSLWISACKASGLWGVRWWVLIENAKDENILFVCVLYAKKALAFLIKSQAIWVDFLLMSDVRFNLEWIHLESLF